MKKIILNENIPYPLIKDLSNHTVTTVQKEGWSGIENGELIALIDGVFDVFITADKNLQYQQNLKHRKIALIELPFNTYDLIVPIISQILNAINQSQKNDYIKIKNDKHA